MFKGVPEFLVRKLKQMRLPKRVKNALRQRYEMKIWKPYEVLRWILLRSMHLRICLRRTGTWVQGTNGGVV